MKQYLYIIIGVLAVQSCTPMKLSVSDELKTNSDEYEVKGRQGILIRQKLGFGAYKTTSVKRSWTKGSSSSFGIGKGSATQGEWVNIISMEYIDRKQTVNFGLTDGTRNADVFCVSRFQAKDLHLGKRENSIVNIAMDIAGIGGNSSSLYYVQIYTEGDGGVPWQLVLDNQAAQANAKRYTGVLAKSSTEYYTIVPVTKLERNGKSGNILMGSVGFELRNPEGRAVAAVSMMDKGMVFLGKTTGEERFLMANVCSALLLQQEIAD